MTFVPDQDSRVRGWNLVRAIVFLALMTFLSLTWLAMLDMGRGTKANHLIAFLPLIGVAVSFLFVLTLERKLGRKGR